MKIDSFKHKIWLSSPTMHGDELKYVTEAYETNWMSTVGKNINTVEQLVAEKVGVRYAVALSAGTASLHLAMKLAGEAMYGQPEIGKGALYNKKVFCSDVTFDATVNPVVYEGGIPVADGVLQENMEEVNYKAYPSALVDKVEVDVAGLKVGDMIRVKDLSLAKDKDIDIKDDLEAVVLAVVAVHNGAVPETETPEEAETEEAK